MPEVHASGSSVGETANELYWNSDQTVGEIVHELGIGRNTLYSSVRPQPAGASCPDCGDDLVFTNRSNRNASTATCPGCGREIALMEHPERADAAEEGQAPVRSAPRRSEPDSGWSRWRHDLAAVAPERAAMIGGAAALGMVVGAVAARAVREPR